MLRYLLTALVLAAPVVVPAPALADDGAGRAVAQDRISRGIRLVMVDRARCVYCLAWKRQVMPGYAASPEGRAAPLAIIAMEGPWPDGLVLASRPFVTPTFILIRDGIEEGRIEGYADPAAFWPMLRALLAEAGVRTERRGG